jgi:hypothetical protein
VEGNSCEINCGTIPAFAWLVWGNPQRNRHDSRPPGLRFEPAPLEYEAEVLSTWQHSCLPTRMQYKTVLNYSTRYPSLFWQLVAVFNLIACNIWELQQTILFSNSTCHDNSSGIWSYAVYELWNTAVILPLTPHGINLLITTRRT